MSRGQRIGLVVAAVVVAVVAFVVAKPGGNDKTGPRTTRIQLKGHKPVGGRKTVNVRKGARVVIVVSSDAPDEIHLHGYDIEHAVGPGRPGRWAFKATNEGAFEMESHKTEQRIALLHVEPR